MEGSLCTALCTAQGTGIQVWEKLIRGLASSSLSSCSKDQHWLKYHRAIDWQCSEGTQFYDSREQRNKIYTEQSGKASQERGGWPEYKELISPE